VQQHGERERKLSKPSEAASGNRSSEVGEYYKRITATPIGDIARELLSGRITAERSGALLVDCPNHKSTSKTSLHVDTRGGLFHCFGCGVGGDVLQLVEFVTDGTVTKLARGERAGESHRRARDWLASRLAMPTLSQVGLSPERIAEIEAHRIESETVASALWQVFDVYHKHLMSGEGAEVREWIKSNYGFDDQVLADFRIGWASPNNRAYELLKRAGVDARTAIATGAFRLDAQDNARPFFEGRVVFPYLSRGRVAYAIGRATPWTNSIDAKAKYKKLQTHNGANRSFVSKTIDNSVLFGEDVLLESPKRIAITEGVTDCIAALAVGIPTVSPVTVRFKTDDVDRIVRRLRGVEEVVFVQDNEFSGIGIDAALSTAERFDAERVKCSIATIPLEDSQREARERLAELLGDRYSEVVSAPPSKRRRLIDEVVVDEADRDSVDGLIANAKIDLCEWLKNNDADALSSLLDSARRPLEVAIDNIRPLDDPVAMVDSIAPILARVNVQRPVDRKPLFQRLKELTGIGVTELRQEANALSKNQKKNATKTKPEDVTTLAEPGTLAASIEQTLTASRLNGESPPWLELSRSTLEWFRANGAVIWKTEEGKPMIFFDGAPFEVVASTAYERHAFQGMFCRTTGVPSGTTTYRAFSSNFADVIVDVSKTKAKTSWATAFVARGVVYFSLGDENRVARIDESGVEVVANGTNEDAVIVAPSPKMAPVIFDADAPVEDLDAYLDKYIGRHLACSKWERRLILDWLSCFPLLGLVGTRPMLRFEGEAGSGKTWAAKMLTTLIYGEERQKKATLAANYVDSERSPVVALDNIETANITRDLLDFFLTVVTGVEREKRDVNSEGTISVTPFCLLLTTGIEPLSGDVVELQGRMFLSWFDKANQAEFGILEKQVLDEIKSVRSRLISLILKRAATVLRLIKRGAHPLIMRGLSVALGDHGKKRANDFIALLYLQRVAAAREEERGAMLDTIDESFLSLIRNSNAKTEAEARESSPIVAALTRFFYWINAEGARPDLLGITMNDIHSTIVDVQSQVLFNALVQCKRDTGMQFEYRNALQFGRRLNMDATALASNGFTVTSKRDRSGKRYYSIRWKRDDTFDAVPAPIVELVEQQEEFSSDTPFYGEDEAIF